MNRLILLVVVIYILVLEINFHNLNLTAKISIKGYRAHILFNNKKSGVQDIILNNKRIKNMSQTEDPQLHSEELEL